MQLVGWVGELENLLIQQKRNEKQNVKCDVTKQLCKMKNYPCLLELLKF